MSARNVMSKLRDSMPGITALALLLILSGCVNPFDSGNGSGNSGRSPSPGTTSLVITLDTVTASTVAPDIANLSALVSSFEVVLTSTNYGTITVPGYTSGNPIADIPADGNWNITVNGTNAGGDLVAIGEPTVPSANPIDLSGAAGSTVAVTVELQPQNSGADGSLTLNLDYSAAVTAEVTVDTIDITLEEQAGGTTETVTATGPTGQVTEIFADPGISDSAQVEVDFDTRLMQISDADMPSGDYVITVTFYEGGEPYAPIIRAVQVYDYLESNVDSATGTDTITLAAGDLTSAPATAPADMIVEFTGENAFNISWSDTTNTEAGYRVYDTTGARTEVADVPSGTLTATGLTAASYSGPGTEDVQFEVVAYNRFGESPALVFDFRVLAAGGGPTMPTLLPGANANSTDWVPAAAPGEVGFGTLVIGGEDSLEFYVDETNDLSDITTLPAAEITETGIYSVPYDLSALTGLAANTTYNLRVGATKVNGGDTNSIYYPVEQFTVRDALHVSSGGIAGAAGTAAAPVDTVNEAIGLAVAGETVEVAAGTYDEVVQVDKAIILQGVGDTTVIQNSTANADEDSMVITAAATVRDLQVVTGTGTTKAAIRVSDAATIEGVLITEDGAAATTIRAISASGAQGLHFNNNRVVLAPAGAASVSTRFGINLINSDATLATPTIIAGNLFEFQTAADGYHVGIQPQDSDHTWIANNVVIQQDAANTSPFIALRFNSAAVGVKAIHNTIVNEDTDKDFTHVETSAGHAPIISNNIFDGSGGSDTLLSLTEDPIEFENNVIWNMTDIGGVIPSVAALNLETYAQHNIEDNPELDPASDYAPQATFTPYRVRSGGKDFTDPGNPEDPGNVDFNGVSRTTGTGVTVGAFELDDTRTLRTLIFNGTIDGVGAGLFQGDVVDDGSTITMNPTLVTTLTDPLNDAKALDYTTGATDEIHYVDGDDIRVIDLGGVGPPFTPVTRGNLITSWTNGLNLSAPNVQDIYLDFDTGPPMSWNYFVADFNEGIYYVDVSNNTIVDLMSYPSINGTAVISDTTPTNMWFANSNNQSLSRASATANTAQGSETQIETVGALENINDIGFDLVDTFWLAVETTNQADGYIAIDTDASGPGDRQVIIPEAETNGEPESIFYDAGLDMIFWTEIGAFYDTDIRMAFGDGHTIGGGYPTLITGGSGAGQLTDGSKLTVKP